LSDSDLSPHFNHWQMKIYQNESQSNITSLQEKAAILENSCKAKSTKIEIPANHVLKELDSIIS